MIPVTIISNEGKVIGQQAFNDNLTAVEEINRIMLATLYCSQQKLTNDKAALDAILANADDAKIAELKTAAEALHKAVADAVAAFEEKLA